MKCAACQCAGRDPETAFLAGIAFVFAFSNDAMRERLCPEHTAALLRGHNGALPTVRPADRRAVPTGSNAGEGGAT